MAGKPVVTANKELLANARARAVRDRRGRGRRPPVRGVGRRRHPAHAPAARVARRRPHPPRDGHRERHDQLHPHPHERRRARRSPTRSPRRRRSASPRRDPTADVEGFDAAAKAAIIASIAFGAAVVAGDVYREGITRDHRRRHRSRRADLGYVVKLLAVAEELDGEVAVRVHPAMVPRRHPLASVRDSFNAVFIEGDAVGELMLYGRGAGGAPTAVGGARRPRRRGEEPRRGAQGRDRGHARAPSRSAPIDEVESQFYLLIEVADRPGVLAAIATEFGRHGVSIRSMQQRGHRRRRAARSSSRTRRARPTSARRSRRSQDVEQVHRVGSVLRVMGEEE